MKKILKITYVILLCVIAGILCFKIYQTRYELLPPYFWAQLEKKVLEYDNFPRAISLMPSWFARYAVFRDRFEDVEFFSTEEVIKGEIFPFQKIWFIDVNNKYPIYRKKIEKVYSVSELFDHKGSKCYEISFKNKPEIYDISKLMATCQYETKIEPLAPQYGQDGDWEAVKRKEIFAGYPRYMYSVKANAFLKHYLQFETIPQFDTLVLYAGLDDSELDRSKTDRSETLISISVNGQLIKRIQLMNLLGVQCFRLDLGEPLVKSILKIEFQAVNGRERECSFNLFLVKDES